MAVDFQHQDYKANINRWQDIDNVVNETNLDQYLRDLNPMDNSEANVKRNNDYKKYAVFYNFTAYTLAGLLGEAYMKEPVIELPAGLDYLKDNCDGLGNSLVQCSQSSEGETLKKGRAGLLTTFPKVDGPISRADISSGKARATIAQIDAKRIVNWRISNFGGISKLSLLVIKESLDEIHDDGFGVKKEDIYRELRLIDGSCIDRKWRKNEKEDKFEIIEGSEHILLDGNGNKWDEIPFSFIGSSNNDSTVDSVDMYYLTKINIAHYVNSADFEDSVWYSGQAQPWASGIDESFLQMMKEHKMYVGGRNLFGVPSGESFGFASAPPNPLARQAMIDKVDLVMGLGARFIQPGSAAKTATQSAGEQKAAYSILSLVSANVSDAYTKALKFAARYMNQDEEAITFQLNTEFLPVSATSADVKEMVAGWVSGAVPTADYTRYMQNIGRFNKETPVEDYIQLLDENAETIE